MGLWPFSSKSPSIKDSGLLNGISDWHSHILPGVDDGFQEMEQSLEALDFMEKAGVKNLWLTPHIMEDYPNETQFLKDKFQELCREYKGKINLHLAAENMLDALFEERMDKKDFLPIGDNGRFLLVETSYYNPPMNMDGALEQIKSLGYYPLLAHPERYRYMDESDYKRLKEMGVLFQANYFSIVGAYGNTARKKLEWLLKNGMIDVMGSDLHKLKVLKNVLEAKPQKKSSLAQLKLLKAASLA